jgi:signal peptidase II
MKAAGEALANSSPLFRAPRGLGLLVALATLAVDQAHKLWMLEVFSVGSRQPIYLTPFLDVVLSWNRGVSYSLLAANSDVARVGLLCMQLAIIAGLCVWLWRTPRRWVALGLGLIVGGAFGNATDRLLRGAVADFFYLHTSLPVGPLANYVFNLADAGITVGVALLLVDSFFAPAKERADAGAA